MNIIIAGAGKIGFAVISTLVKEGHDVTAIDLVNKNVSTIINTHSNADHAGGNKYFFEKYNCKILTTKKESAV